jgi:maltose alpha-D-glucosyltransferase/alpha-amylase
MQWTGDRNAGFSLADPQSLYLPVITTPEYHYETINVETQQANPQSLLWWHKRLIALRKQHPVLGRGSLQFLQPQNSKVLAFFRRDESETLLIVANLSRFFQAVELELSGFQGYIPVELFGQSPLPPVGESNYLLTIGPHAIYWFTLREPVTSEIEAGLSTDGPPLLTAESDWQELLQPDSDGGFEKLLPEYLQRQRWFGGKSRRIRRVRIAERVQVPHADGGAVIVFVRVEYTDGEPDVYLLCLACAGGEEAAILQHGSDVPVLAAVQLADSTERGIIYDALFDPRLSEAILQAIARQRRFKGIGSLVCQSTRALRTTLRESETPLEPILPKVEQSNSSVVFRDEQGTGRYILKLFRRIEQGINPDVELVRFLTRKAHFDHVPAYAGAIEYRRGREVTGTMALLQDFVPNEGDAWSYTTRIVRDYFEHVIVRQVSIGEEELPEGSLVAARHSEPSPLVTELVGDYLYWARLLGQRTGEMHAALAGDTQNPSLVPERFLYFHRHALHHEVLGRLRRSLRLLQQQVSSLPQPARDRAKELLGKEAEVRLQMAPLKQARISAKRIRIHGDYHLGQVLFTGKDFVIIDFEGEPAVPLSERRIKRSALRDVAGMLRSFHYAAQSPLAGEVADPIIQTADSAVLETAAEFWYRWVATAFLNGYLTAVESADLLPKSDDELTILLEAFLFDKAGYELMYELNNRPGWVSIPINGLLGLLPGE